MMLDRTIIRFWGRERLKRWDRQVVDKLLISASSKTFLVDVGMPIRATSQLMFEWTEDFSRMPDMPHGRWLALESGRAVFLDESRNGHVFLAGTDCDPARYVNASVEQLAACITEYEELASKKVAIGGAQGRRAAGGFVRRIRKIDPTALDEPGWNMWSVLTEEMRS